MDESQYHASPAVGSTDLKNLLRSPAHFKAARETLHEPTPDQIFGTLVHRAVLEPDRFADTTIVQPSFTGKGSVAAKADWCTENEGKDIVSQRDLDAILGITSSLKNHLTARALLNGAKFEQSYFARDFDSGIDCKARVDIVRDNALIDLKTAQDASASAFARTVGNYLYYLQAAHYLQTVNDSTGLNYTRFLFIAVEKKYPFAVAVYELDQTAIQAGNILRARALQVLAEAQASGRFDAYPQEITKVMLAPWSLGMKD